MPMKGACVKPPRFDPAWDIDLLAQQHILRLNRRSRSEPPDERPPDQSAKVRHAAVASLILPSLASVVSLK
jgi:hypothetical protein